MIGTVVTCLQTQHDPRFLVAAILICVISSTTAICLLGKSHAVSSAPLAVKLLPAICVTSIGIWATHFVAVLGYNTGMDTQYSLTVTAIAALFSFVTVAFGMVFGAYFNSIASHALGGLYLGLGISVMHLLGMFAIQVPGTMMFHMPSTISAIGGCCVISATAFALFASLRTRWRYPLASLLLVLAVCFLHFVQISWTEFIPSYEMSAFDTGVNGTVLAMVVFSLWMFVTLIVVARHWSLQSDDPDQFSHPSHQA